MRRGMVFVMDWKFWNGGASSQHLGTCSAPACCAECGGGASEHHADPPAVPRLICANSRFVAERMGGPTCAVITSALSTRPRGGILGDGDKALVIELNVLAARMLALLAVP